MRSDAEAVSYLFTALPRQHAVLVQEGGSRAGGQTAARVAGDEGGGQAAEG